MGLARRYDRDLPVGYNHCNNPPTCVIWNIWSMSGVLRKRRARTQKGGMEHVSYEGGGGALLGSRV
jgi:hypothetical protein